MIKLFIELGRSAVFYFYQSQEKKLVKVDHSHYVGPSGTIQKINPHVAIFVDDHTKSTKSIYNQTEGDINV